MLFDALFGLLITRLRCHAFRVRSEAAFLLVAVGLSLCMAAAHAEAPTDYRRELESFSQELTSALRMERAVPGSSRQALAALSARVPHSVLVGQGNNAVETDLNWLRKGLSVIRRTPAKDRAKQIADLLGRVQTYRSAVRDAPRNDPESLSHANSTLNAVLRRAEYKRSPVDTLSKRVWRLIADILSSVNVPPQTTEVIGWVLLVAVIVVFVLLLVLLAMRLTAYYSGRRFQPAPGGTTRTITRKTRQSLEALMTQAELDAAEGRYRNAFRHVYMAALLLLDRSKLVTYTDSGTNWEYLRALRRQGAEEQSEAFHGMTLLFDQLIYGKRDVSKDDYAACLHHFKRLEAAI